MVTNLSQPAKLIKSYTTWIKLSIFFIGLAVLTGLIALVFEIFAIDTPNWLDHSFEIFGPIILGIACLIFILLIVFFCKTLYNLWEIIQDDKQARTQPNLAVGLLFVPLFNLYWTFIALFGLSQDLNKYIDRHGISTIVRAKEGLALTWFVLCCLCVVPYLNILTGIAIIPISYLCMTNFKKVAVEISNKKKIQSR